MIKLNTRIFARALDILYIISFFIMYLFSMRMLKLSIISADAFFISALIILLGMYICSRFPLPNNQSKGGTP
jgi:hypothetical protein